MIYITGDIHGSPERLGVHSFYEQKEMTRDDIVIICGDFGMVWEESGESASEQYWLKWLEDKPFTTVFVCGNHENFDRLYQYPVKEWHGGNRSFRHKRKWIMVSKILNVLATKWITLSHIHHLQV